VLKLNDSPSTAATGGKASSLPQVASLFIPFLKRLSPCVRLFQHIGACESSILSTSLKRRENKPPTNLLVY